VRVSILEDLGEATVAHPGSAPVHAGLLTLFAGLSPEEGDTTLRRMKHFGRRGH
jgi:hypothetical protein